MSPKSFSYPELRKEAAEKPHNNNTTNTFHSLYENIIGWILGAKLREGLMYAHLGPF